MGWGALFVGYVCTFVLGLNPVFSVFLALPGWALSVWGLRGLARYERTFRYSLWCALATVPVCLWQTLQGASDRFSLSVPFLSAQLSAVLEPVSMVLTVLYHTLLALAIVRIARKVSLQKNATRAARDAVLVWLYGIGGTLTGVAGERAWAATVVGAVLLLRLLWAVLFAVLLYSCYMHICPAEDSGADAPPKPFGIGWLDRFRTRAWEKEQKAISADREYHAKNAREQRDKQLSRLSQKQRDRQIRKGK